MCTVCKGFARKIIVTYGDLGNCPVKQELRLLVCDYHHHHHHHNVVVLIIVLFHCLWSYDLIIIVITEVGCKTTVCPEKKETKMFFFVMSSIKLDEILCTVSWI